MRGLLLKQMKLLLAVDFPEQADVVQLCRKLMCLRIHAMTLRSADWDPPEIQFIRNYKGSAESEGEGGHFHFAACLPFAPQNFQEFAKFQEILIASVIS